MFVGLLVNRSILVSISLAPEYTVCARKVKTDVSFLLITNFKNNYLMPQQLSRVSNEFCFIHLSLLSIIIK